MDNPSTKSLSGKIRIYQYGSFLSKNHECLSPISYTPPRNQETQIDLRDNLNLPSIIKVKANDYVDERAAKTVLKEANDLKNIAGRMKATGSSGQESSGILFQAALKFLHGASLLESYNNETTTGNMSPNEAYTIAAELCEKCAREYEKCNDMASAALAYKCMEVAYMRLVYCNDNLNQSAIYTITTENQDISTGSRPKPNIMQLLDFTHYMNLAMEASRKSQGAFAAAQPIFTQAGNEKSSLCIKSVLDFSFHDVDAYIHLVRLALDSIDP